MTGGPSMSAADPATIPEMFARRLAADADVPFLLSSDGRSWTFRGLDHLAARLAEELREQGVGEGDIIGLYQWNDTSWFVSALAVWRLGAVVACCGSVSPAAEAVRRFALVRPAIVLSSEPAVLDGFTVITVDESGQVGGADAGSGPEASHGPAVTPSPDQPAAIFFTSGTTGDAKPVVKVHGQFPEAARATATAYSRSPSFRPRMADSTKPPALGFNPFGQAACFGRLVFRLYIGRPLIQIRKFDVAVVQQLATRYDFDTLQLTPAMVHSLAFTDLDVSLGKLQYVSSGTAPLAPATRDEFERRYGVPVLQAYGSTEGGVTALERYDDVTAGRRGTGSVGRITAESTWRIVLGDGTDAAPGEEGEILGKPRTVTMAEAGISALPLDADGWYHTGDIGRVDEHGILYITGRVKDMLIVGGFNVYPGEVEDALRESPLVRDAMVVGRKDERLGEIPVAALVWNPAATRERSEAEALAEVIERARGLLAAYKVPRRWLTVEAIPLTPNGKPDRLGLARRADAESRSTADITVGAASAIVAARPEGGADGVRA